MPAVQAADGLLWLRPWLHVPRDDIDAYVGARALRFVDDDSNASTRHRRNALRHDVVPGLRAIAPGYPGTLARAATHQAEAAALLHELAAEDAAPFMEAGTLHRAALSSLSPMRARNVLRWFLHERGLPAPSAARLGALLDQLRNARGDAALRLRHAGSEIGLFRERIHAHVGAPLPFEAGWKGDAPLSLPHGDLRAGPAAGGDGDVDLDRLFAAGVVVRSRTGGERVRLGPGRPTRALKSLLREAALPPWERAALPLVFAGNDLAVVPGIAVDPAYRPRPGASAGTLVWTPLGARDPARIAPAGPFG
jgi:tRNA(Ile)-lysidine synthase